MEAGTRANPLKLMSVRSAMTAALATLALLGAGVVLSLVLLTTQLHGTTVTLNRSVDGLRTAEAIEGDLLRHSRLADPALQQTIEADLRSLLGPAHRFELDDEQRQIVDRLGRAAEGYFSAFHAATSAGLPPEQAAARASTELGLAFATARQYADMQVAQAQEARARAARWNDVAAWIGMAAGLSMLIAAGLGTIWVRSVAFAPIRRISEAMRQFRGGDQGSRAPVEGPSELRAIAEDFNETAGELAEQQQRQLAFLAGVVHDLRNPLSALQLSTARLDPARGRLTDEQARSTLGMVRRQLDLLNRMTGDLLDAARIRRGQLELKKQDRDIREMAREGVELYRSGTRDHELKLEVPDEPVLVTCDPLRIEQVLNNLISNAIKYSPAGGPVSVNVQRDDQEALISVSDKGVGIAADDVPHIFEAFRRSGATKETIRGVGLGLYVTERIVDAHAGTIDVRSTPGEGSTFTVRLPLAASQTTASLRRAVQPD